MQTFIAFCSLCLQLSKLMDPTPEFALKRDEACTLCLADVLHTSSNRSSNEILSDGLYFANPLLHDALKLKMEHEFLVQSEDCLVQEEFEQVSNLGREQAEEALQSFAERLSKLPSDRREIQNGLIRQKNEISEKVQTKLHALKNFYQTTFQGSMKMEKVPQHAHDMFSSVEKAGAEILERIEMKMNAFSEETLRERQEFSLKTEELKKKISQTQDPQALQNIVQEAKQAVEYIEEQYKLQYGIEQGPTISDLDKTVKDFLGELSGFLKPSRTTLKIGEKLKVDERIFSENGIFSLVMEEAFILNLYKFDQVIWRHQCQTGGMSLGSQELLLNQDGVLVIQDERQEFSEAFNKKNPSYSGDGAYLTVTNAGEVQISESGRKLWTPLYSSPVSDVWKGPESLNFLVSENGVYTLRVTSECYLVLYEGPNLIWFKSLHPPGESAPYCNVYFDHNGQLVSHTGLRTNRLRYLVLVQPENAYRKQISLIVRNDGIVAIMGSGEVLWTSQKDSFD